MSKNAAKPPAGMEYIYFMGTEDGREIKIGKSKRHPSARHGENQRTNGRHEPLRILAVVLGSPSDESALKSYFKAKSRNRSAEWIWANEEMRGYLRFLRDLPYVAVDPAEDTIYTLPLVDSGHWLPNAIRHKSISQLEIPLAEDNWADLRTSEVMKGDFYTSSKIIDAARTAMGTIDLDPASCRQANEVVRADRFYGVKEDGLLQPWYGNVWVNPPFGNWERWTDKLLGEWRRGDINQICALCSSRASTNKSFQGIHEEAAAVWMAYGRLPFWGPKAGEPDEGHFVFYFGDQAAQFQSAFEANGLGTVYQRHAMRVPA